MGPPPNFQIHESRVNGTVRLTLTGELDFAATPQLDARLTRLRVSKSPVSLDLSHLEFVDSTGLRLLIRAAADARTKHWQLRIEPDIAPPVLRLFRLVHLDRFLMAEEPPVA
jgi:anti-anti-sigma factor